MRLVTSEEGVGFGEGVGRRGGAASQRRFEGAAFGADVAATAQRRARTRN
jgi:hypothetical protein